MECKNLGRGTVSFISYIHQGAFLFCAGFVRVSEQFAGVRLFLFSLWFVYGSVCSFL